MNKRIEPELSDPQGRRPDPPNPPAAAPGLPACDARCERYKTCRPDSPGWVFKKQVAANLKSTPSALKQRAARIGYVSPSLLAMPRRDQPRLCLDAWYFALLPPGKGRRPNRRS